jgi:four helix bundle protein
MRMRPSLQPLLQESGGCMSFSFEKLDVYTKALELSQRIEFLQKELRGKVSYSLLDQLNRATLSVPLNIAEGNGRWHKGDKRNFFWIARGSVFEIVPIIQVLFRNRQIDESLYNELYVRLEDLSKMLFRLVRSVDNLNQS